MVAQWSCHLLVKWKYNPHFYIVKKGGQRELRDCQFHLHAHVADCPENCANKNRASLSSNCAWQIINLVSSYSGITTMMDKGKATEVIFLNLYKKFDTLLQDIFFSKLKTWVWQMDQSVKIYRTSRMVALKEL